MLRYWFSVLREGWRAYLERIQGGRRYMIAFTIQTAVLLGLLYFAPWLGVLRDEARLVAATVAAILASGVFTLFWEIFKAPARLAMADKAELIRLSGALGFMADMEAVREEGYAIYERWRKAMPPGDLLKADYSAAAEVEAEAEAFIRKHYPSSDLMSYRYGMGYKSEDDHAGTPKFYKLRLDRFHTIILSHYTVADSNIVNFTPEGLKNVPQ